MKRAFLSIAGAIVTGLLVSAPAEAAKVRFIGALTIVSQGGTCDFNRVGDRFFAAYQPANLGDNGGDTNLTLFHQSWALGFRKNGGSFTSAFQEVDWITVGDGGFGFDPNVHVFLKITTQGPPSLSANTAFVNLVGQILNFDFDQDCVIVFTAAFTKKVEN